MFRLRAVSPCDELGVLATKAAQLWIEAAKPANGVARQARPSASFYKMPLAAFAAVNGRDILGRTNATERHRRR